MRNGQRVMTKKRKKQQPEEMKWSLKDPNIKKKCLARELWQQPQEERYG
jgi:hypothetical protein